MKGIINREITQKECPWLEKDLQKGKVVYKYNGYTCGVIGSNGIAVTEQPDETPFFEVPESAIDWENDNKGN